jgi:hypothetical protein
MRCHLSEVPKEKTLYFGGQFFTVALDRHPNWQKEQGPCLRSRD